MEATKEIRLFIKQNIHQLCIDYMTVSKTGFRKNVPTFDELFDMIEAQGGGIGSMTTAILLVGSVAVEWIAEGAVNNQIIHDMYHS